MKKEIIVKECDIYFEDEFKDGITLKIDEFFDFIKSKFDFSDPNYNHEITICLNESYNDNGPNYYIFDCLYCSTTRPETNEEYEKRLKKEKEREERLRLEQIEKEEKRKKDLELKKEVETKNKINKLKELYHELNTTLGEDIVQQLLKPERKE